MVKQYTNLIDKIPHTIRLVFKNMRRFYTEVVMSPKW